jgi:hypothetical protein
VFWLVSNGEMERRCVYMYCSGVVLPGRRRMGGWVDGNNGLKRSGNTCSLPHRQYATGSSRGSRASPRRVLRICQRRAILETCLSLVI